MQFANSKASEHLQCQYQVSLPCGLSHSCIYRTSRDSDDTRCFLGNLSNVRLHRGKKTFPAGIFTYGTSNRVPHEQFACDSCDMCQHCSQAKSPIYAYAGDPKARAGDSPSPRLDSHKPSFRGGLKGTSNIMVKGRDRRMRLAKTMTRERIVTSNFN